MRLIGLFLPVLLILGVAFWANQETNLTKSASERAVELSRQIEHSRVVFKFLQDEWAYLNRPNRLKRLADAHYEELRLSPITHLKFRPASSIPLRNEFDALPGTGSDLLVASPQFAQLGR